MSGIGIFFTLILVLAAVYFIGGAFYNYKIYNARGRDLIPHIGKSSALNLVKRKDKKLTHIFITDRFLA